MTTLSQNSRVTIGVLLVIIPLVVWAAKLDNRVERLEQDRAELKTELREVSRKMDILLRRTSHEHP